MPYSTPLLFLFRGSQDEYSAIFQLSLSGTETTRPTSQKSASPSPYSSRIEMFVLCLSCSIDLVVSYSPYQEFWKINGNTKKRSGFYALGNGAIGKCPRAGLLQRTGEIFLFSLQVGSQQGPKNGSPLR